MKLGGRRTTWLPAGAHPVSHQISQLLSDLRKGLALRAPDASGL